MRRCTFDVLVFSTGLTWGLLPGGGFEGQGGLLFFVGAFGRHATPKPKSHLSGANYIFNKTRNFTAVSNQRIIFVVSIFSDKYLIYYIKVEISKL